MTMQTTHALTFESIPTTYARLVGKFPLRPIHDPTELDNATEILDAMALHNEDFTPDQADFFDVLSTLVETYETQHDPLLIPKASPLETLKSLLVAHEMSASDLGRILGNRELGSKILRGARKLTVNHIKKLAERFSVTPSLFIP